MQAKIRDFFTSTETQAHITHIIHNTISISFHLAFLNKNIDDQNYKDIKSNLTRLANSDLIELSKLFLERFDYKTEYGDWSKGNIVSVLRAVKNNSSNLRSKTREISENFVKSFYANIRELAPLIRLMREHRNYFAHNSAQIRTDIGWNSSVLSCLMRLCELSTVPKTSYETNVKMISKCRENFAGLLGGEPVEQQVVSKEGGGDEIKLEPLLPLIEGVNEELKEIRTNLKLTEENILKSLSNIGLINSSKDTSKENTSPEEEEEIDEENYGEYDPDFNKSITPEILRAELRLLNRKIGAYFAKDKSFAPSLNIVSISVIGEILEHEPKNLMHLLSLENIKFVFDDHKEILSQQVKKFGSEVDELLKNVLWPPTF